MQPDRDYELVALVRYARPPRPPDGLWRPRRQWRWRRQPVVVPLRRLAPDPVPGHPAPLDIHEYLELEFAVGQESRR